MNAGSVETIRADVLGPQGAQGIEISLLGGFQLRYQDEPVTIPLGSQRVVAFVAMHDRLILRSHVAGVLWPDTTEERAGRNLRSALWRLPVPSRAVVKGGGGQLGLAAGVDVDLREAASAAHRLLDGSDERAVALDPGAFSGDLLPDWYDDWVTLERERYRQLRLHALEVLCCCYTAAHRYAEAVQAGVTAVSCEPLRESAHRVLIQAHLAEGNRAEAIRQYASYRTLMDEELGVEPSPDIRELVRPLGV